MTTVEKSVRQARRERTYLALHNAALDLVEEKGLKATTTDEIADRAGVSPRTLFNYFAGKEDAVLGLRTPALTAEVLQQDAARHEAPFIERLVHLALGIIVASVDGPTYARVLEQVDRYPELRYRMRLHNIECENVLREFLLSLDWQTFQQRNRRGPFVFREATSAPATDVQDRAHAVVNMTTAVLRHLDFVRGIPESARRDELIRQAVATFRYLLREG
ncbi:MAG: helix-turn-helix domain-containing protein [Rothia sp. (in: high G+C Gram-positive bacteria)]|nr:helix-turn-helix domain-containing protein [Rothia sp. (in: high G+C Gram-positive bacteria)]